MTPRMTFCDTGKTTGTGRGGGERSERKRKRRKREEEKGGGHGRVRRSEEEEWKGEKGENDKRVKNRKGERVCRVNRGMFQPKVRYGVIVVQTDGRIDRRTNRRMNAFKQANK